MKTSTEQIKDLLWKIHALNKDMKSIPWTEKEIADTQTGIHVAKLESYLDAALGRASSLLDRSQLLSK